MHTIKDQFQERNTIKLEIFQNRVICRQGSYPYEIEMSAADLQQTIMFAERGYSCSQVCAARRKLIANIGSVSCKHAANSQGTDLDRKEIAKKIIVCIMFATTLQ